MSVTTLECEEAAVLFPDENELNFERGNDESEPLRPELQREDEKLQKLVNRTVRKRRIAHLKGQRKKPRTADSYLNTESRRALAKALQDKARSHKINFLRLSEICDADPTIPGVISQVQNAATSLSQNESVAELLPEAVAAGESQLEMEVAMRALEAELDGKGEGVPVTCSLELTRRIFDEELSESKEILQRDYSSEDEED